MYMVAKTVVKTVTWSKISTVLSLGTVNKVDTRTRTFTTSKTLESVHAIFAYSSISLSQ